MDKTIEKTNGKCVLCILSGIAIFVALLLTALSLKINSSDFPGGIFVGVAIIVAAVMIIYGCHKYRLVPRNEVGNREV